MKISQGLGVGVSQPLRGGEAVDGLGEALPPVSILATHVQPAMRACMACLDCLDCLAMINL